MSATYSQLKTDVSNRLHNKLGRVTSIRDCLNTGVRKAVTVPLRTLRRKYSVPVRLLDDVYDYTAPSDIQGNKVIDLQPVVAARPSRYQWTSVNPAVFDRYRGLGRPVLSVVNSGLAKTLKATIGGNDRKVTVSELDSITDGGTWAAVGTASSLATDTTYYIYGNGSVSFNLGAGTQDGISTTLSTDLDISGYRPDGSAYFSVSLPSVSGVTGVTLRLGSDASNYIELSATSDIAGNSIVSGFNLFAVKLSDGTETGSPDYENIDYVALLIDKDATTLTGVRVDRIAVGSGGQHQLDYYSRYGWQSSAGTWMENSTADTDILNAETEEYDLIVEYCVIEAANAAREYQDASLAMQNVREMRKLYRRNNPDASLVEKSDIWLTNSQSFYNGG